MKDLAWCILFSKFEHKEFCTVEWYKLNLSVLYLQRIIFNVESKELGFLVHVTEENPAGPQTTQLQINVLRISGEVRTKAHCLAIFPRTSSYINLCGKSGEGWRDNI